MTLQKQAKPMTYCLYPGTRNTMRFAPLNL